MDEFVYITNAGLARGSDERNTYIGLCVIFYQWINMVSCSLTGIQSPCPGSGALAGVFLYPTEINVADGAQVKLQIMTRAYECDDTGFVPTDYCIDWGDGFRDTGTFPSGYASPKNVELTHVYRYRSSQYDSTSFNPAVTIGTACGGIRTVNTGEAGNSCKIYVWQPGTTSIPAPNMSTYRLHPDFNFASCAGIFPDCSGTETNPSTCQKCVGGFWARDLDNHACDSTGGMVCNGNLKCVNGMYYDQCTKDGITGMVGTGQSCAGGEPYVPPPYVPPGYETPVDTGGGDGTDILASIMDFYENNKLVSIGAIALLGGIVLFGGGGHRD